LPISVLVKAPTIELLARQLQPGGGNAGYRTLVPIRPEGSLPPFFCVHGGLGSTLFMHHLAERINSFGRPFYGLEPDCLDGSRTRNETVEKMASAYLAAIRSVQPSGPYYLGGYCFGGLVAYEMARQLLARSENVAAVVLIAAPLRFNGQKIRASQASESAHPVSRLSRFSASPGRFVSQYWRRLREILESRYHSGLTTISHAASIRIPQKFRREYISGVMSRAELAYKPQPYPGSLTLLYGSKLTEFGPDLGWGGLAGTLEHHLIGESEFTTRRDLFREPEAGLTARTLHECLERAEGANPSGCTRGLDTI
jgi:thioesterase domain-containing protein